MHKKITRRAFCSMLLALPFPAWAQQPARIPRIGILIPPSASFFSARVEAFRQRLRELGYVEGKNIFIEYRYAEGKLERLPDLAAELVRLKVDVIVATGPAILAAKKASPTIPIVFAAAGDPVGSGLVSSLARPGGNITGLSSIAQDLDGKRLELVKEAFPKIARVAFLWEPGGSRGNPALTDMEAAAKALGLKLQSLEVRGLDDFESAFARAKKEGAQALIATVGSVIATQQRQVLDFAA
ncbi:MAG: ABC transporter substrate-binding protein, partial [Deltaproteobacteria bacterium]|nr:ABC transporter substrate-binding protein [Deltaproteobacteria bacterium]